MQDKAEKQEKEQQVENFMFLRMIKLMIKTNKYLEDARSSLVSHKTFTLQDSFSLFDVNQNGKITAEELAKVFTDN